MANYIDTIREYYPTVKELESGDFKSFRIGPMKNEARHFDVEGFGHVSIMESSALCGLMKMEAVNIVPTKVDLPLLSFDTISVLGNKTTLVELYEIFLRKENFNEEPLLKIKEEVADYPDYEAEERWYTPLRMASSWAKKVKKNDAKAVEEKSLEVLKAFLEIATKAEPLVNGEIIIKQELESAFATRLVEQGGVSTDMFVKKIGKEETLKFFHSVFYGV